MAIFSGWTGPKSEELLKRRYRTHVEGINFMLTEILFPPKPSKYELYIWQGGETARS